jgi:hypothetical protein
LDGKRILAYSSKSQKQGITLCRFADAASLGREVWWIGWGEGRKPGKWHIGNASVRVGNCADTWKCLEPWDIGRKCWFSVGQIKMECHVA